MVWEGIPHNSTLDPLGFHNGFQGLSRVLQRLQRVIQGFIAPFGA